MEWLIAALIALRTILQGYCQMQVTVLKAIDRMQAIGAIQTVHSIVLLLALWRCYVARANIYVVIAALVVAQSVELLLEAAWIRRSGIRLVRVHLRDCWQLLHGSTAVGVAVSLSSVIFRLDVIVLSLIAGAAAAGVFAAAQTLVIIVYLLGSLLASVLFPADGTTGPRSGGIPAILSSLVHDRSWRDGSGQPARDHYRPVTNADSLRSWLPGLG